MIIKLQLKSDYEKIYITLFFSSIFIKIEYTKTYD